METETTATKEVATSKRVWIGSAVVVLAGLSAAFGFTLPVDNATLTTLVVEAVAAAGGLVAVATKLIAVFRGA